MADFFRYENLSLLFGNILDAYLMFLLIKTYYPEKARVKGKKSYVLLVFAILAIARYAINIKSIVYLNGLSTLLIYFIPLFLLYEVKNIRGIAYFAFYVLAAIIEECVLVLALNVRIEGQQARADLVTPEAYAILTLIQLVTVALIITFGNKDRNPMYDRVTLLFMIAPVLSGILLGSISFAHVRGRNIGMSEMAIGKITLITVIFNVMIFVILEKYTKIMKSQMELTAANSQMRADGDLLEMAAKSMRERLIMTEESMERDRVMRHDRRHFEGIILSLIEEGEYDRASELLKQRLNAEDSVAQKYCKNITINAEINHYIKLAGKNNIRVAANLNIPEELSVDELELSLVIGNLIENAIRACCEIEEGERYINIVAKYKNQLLFEIENPFVGTAEFDQNGYPVVNEPGHGVGTKSIVAFVNKTDSNILYRVADNVFKVRLLVEA